MYSCLIVTDDKAETEEYLKLAKQSGGIIKSSIKKDIRYINYYDEDEEECDALIYLDEKELNLGKLALIFEDIKFDTIEFYNCKHLDKITMDRIENLFKKKFEDCLDYDGCWECIHINECHKELRGNNMDRCMIPYPEVMYEKNDEIKRLKEEWLANRDEYLFYLKCYRVMFSNGHDYGEQWIEVLTNINECREIAGSLDVKLRLNGVFY